MTRYFVYLSLLLGMGFSVGLLVMRLRPYDNHPIRELLPDTCAEPCFAGIYPGSTSDDDALQLLKASTWVDADSVRLIRLLPSASKFDDLSHIEWSWSDTRPDWIVSGAQIPNPNINIRNHVVESIAFNTSIPAAAAFHKLGTPSLLVFATIRSHEPWGIEWLYRYENTQLILHMEVKACPYLADLWEPTMQVQMVTRPDSPFSTKPAEMDMRTILYARKLMMCSLS